MRLTISYVIILDPSGVEGEAGAAVVDDDDDDEKAVGEVAVGEDRVEGNTVVEDGRTGDSQESPAKPSGQKHRSSAPQTPPFTHLAFPQTEPPRKNPAERSNRVSGPDSGQGSAEKIVLTEFYC